MNFSHIIDVTDFIILIRLHLFVEGFSPSNLNDALSYNIRQKLGKSISSNFKKYNIFQDSFCS